MARTRMPWGKHAGQPLDEIEASYLVWVLERANQPAAWLITAIKAELASRFNATSAPPPPASAWNKPCPNPAIATSIIATGLRTLARKHHPDVEGGDTETMKTINLVADWLRRHVPQ